MKIQVGKKYVSDKAGIVDCIAEREGIFIVENDEYCYHVNQAGVALYTDNNKWYRQTDNEFDLQCEVGFDSEDDSKDDFDVAKVLNSYLESVHFSFQYASHKLFVIMKMIQNWSSVWSDRNT